MAVLRATDETGVYEIEGLGTKIRLLEWRAGSFYDTVQFASDGITNQTQSQQYLFQNLQNKSRVFTNLDNNAGRIPALNELITNRVGAHVLQSFGNTVISDADIIKFAHSAYVRFAVNQSRLVVDAPLYTLQSGYGVTGSTTRNATGIATIGVASAAAAPQLLVAQPIGPNDSISGSDSYIAIQANNWSQSGNMPGTANAIVPQPNILPVFASSVFLTLFLDGLIKKPATA
jgi:hypothetical protein